MKRLFLLFVAQICILHLQAQRFAISNDKFNIAYIGVDNPLSIAVENCPCNKIVVKADNGTIIGKNCKFIYRGVEPGFATVKVYRKMADQLKEVGQYGFRVKRIPPPVFKIGPYSGNYGYNIDRKVQKILLAYQQFVRAELDFFDIDVRYTIDSFSVKVFYNDSAELKTFFNATSRISQQLSEAFLVLKKDDIMIFYNIFAKGPDGLEYELDPLILTIDK